MFLHRRSPLSPKPEAQHKEKEELGETCSDERVTKEVKEGQKSDL